MKYIAFIADGESPLRYASVKDEHLKQMYAQIEEEELEPNFVEVEDIELISQLIAAVVHHIDSGTGYQDENGNKYTVEPYGTDKVEWSITMQ